MNAHLEPDPTEGVPIGRDPRTLSEQELAALGHHKRPLLRAIRDNCIGCCAGNAAEVRRCGMVACPLWPYRMGSNPFVRREMTDDQREVLAERLHAGRHRRPAPTLPVD